MIMIIYSLITHLAGAEPEGPFAGVVLRKDGKHALYGPEHGSVDHHRSLHGCALRLVLQLEADGQLEVQLHCCALELPPQGIEDGDVNLGAIEGPITLIDLQDQPIPALKRIPSKCNKPFPVCM